MFSSPFSTDILEDSLRTVPWLEFLDGTLIGWDDDCEENEDVVNNEEVNENVNAQELTDDDDVHEVVQPMQIIDENATENNSNISTTENIIRDMDMSENCEL